MIPLDLIHLRPALQALGEALQREGHQSSILVWSRDCFVLAPLPSFLAEAAHQVAEAHGFPPNWLSDDMAGGRTLTPPPALEEEVRWEVFGTLRAGFVGRLTVMAFKLLASVDQGTNSGHFRDLVALQPTSEDLVDIAGWVRDQDDRDWFQHWVWETIKLLRERVPPEPFMW